MNNTEYRHSLSINKKLCYTLLTSYPLDQTGLDGFPRKISPHYSFMTSPWNHTEDEVSKFATYFVCAKKLFWIHHLLHYQNFMLSGVIRNLLDPLYYGYSVGEWVVKSYIFLVLYDRWLPNFISLKRNGIINHIFDRNDIAGKGWVKIY